MRKVGGQKKEEEEDKKKAITTTQPFRFSASPENVHCLPP